jgi:hypothetical protein
VSSPTRDDLLQIPVAGPSTIQPEPCNNEVSVENLAIANQQESAPNRPGQESGQEDSVGSVNSNVDRGWSAVQHDEELSDHLIGSEDFLGQEQLHGPGDNHSDSESHISFVSEHPSLNSEGGDVNETTAHDFVVQKLYDELVQGFHGCTEEEHDEDRRRHMIDAGENHHARHRLHSRRKGYGLR